MLAVVAATASASFTARNRDRLVEVLKNVDTSKLDHTFAAASGLKAAGVDAPKVGAVSSTHRLPGFQHNLLEQRNRQTDRQSVSQSDSQTVSQTVSQSVRQTNRYAHTDTQAHRHTHTEFIASWRLMSAILVARVVVVALVLL